MSESSDYRHLLDVHKILLLSPGENRIILYAIRQDKKRAERSEKAKLFSTKVRRNLLAENREKLRKKNEDTEGVEYESDCGWNHDNDSNQMIDSQIALISENKLLISADNCGVVYFDLETSDFGQYREILQFAASYKDFEFSVDVNPTKEISAEASLHTGLRNIAGQLYVA